MKRILIISIILLLNSIIYSQSITWQKVYKGQSLLDCFGYDICFADSNNFFIIGTNQYPEGAYIIKINPQGDTLWTKFVEDRRGFAGVSSDDGGCIVIGSWMTNMDGLITYSLKIDPNKNIIWLKEYYNSQSSICNRIIRTSDNKYLACGKIGYQLGYIIKIDSVGDRIWQKSYSSLDDKVYYSIIETNDNSYIAGGYVTDTPYETGKGVLTKIDTSGNIIWEKRYNMYKHSMGNITSIDKVNHNYLITGHAHDSTTNQYGICFMRLDSLGNVIFSRFYPQPDSGQYWMPNSKIINLNKYIFSYNRYGSSALDSILANAMITDSLGNIIIHKEFNSTDYTYFNRILLNNNNDILFVGNSNHINPDFENIYVVRADSNLYAPPIGINNIISINPNDYKLYQNYPNPFNPITIIRYSLKRKSNVVLNIYNVIGRRIASLINKSQKSGQYKFTFSNKKYQLPSSVYFFSLFINGDYIDTKKMLLIK